MGKIYVGDVGVEIRLDVGVDISEATLLEIHGEDPEGTAIEWTATEYDSTHITYTTEDGDLDVAGAYLLQAYAEWGETSKHHGELCQFVVFSLV